MPDVVAQFSRVNLSSDPLYRYIRITRTAAGRSHPSEQDLIDNAWLQRLRRIHQLQSAWWVFVTAEHSRLQHALGAMHLAGEWARHLYPTLILNHPDAPSEAVVEETLRMAGLLHDVGHGPFGHFFDQNYLDRWDIDHETIGRRLIQGELAPMIQGLRTSPHGEFENGQEIEPAWVAYLIAQGDLDGFQAPAWLNVLKPLLNGSFSADNMDYVPRDSYVCGVAVGPVDLQRIIHYSFISEQGLALHDHAAEALFMFLNARLYLYHQVYFHRTVRRIDLQLREIFRPTIDILLGGNPLDCLDRYQQLTEWQLMSEVDRWARAEGVDAQLRELGGAWAATLARRLKWRLVFSSYLESREITSRLLYMTRDEFAGRIREKLDSAAGDTEFEVDVAAQESGARNPLADTGDILLYDPLEDRYRQSSVLDLFGRLPVRMALFRIFARDLERAPQLRQAAESVLRNAR